MLQFFEFLNPERSIRLLFEHDSYAAIGLLIGLAVFFVGLLVRRSLSDLPVEEHIPELLALDLSILGSVVVALSSTYRSLSEAPSDVVMCLVMVVLITLAAWIVGHVRAYRSSQRRLDHTVACVMGWALLGRKDARRRRFRELTTRYPDPPRGLYPFNTEVRGELSALRREKAVSKLRDDEEIVLRHESGWTQALNRGDRVLTLSYVAIFYVLFCAGAGLLSLCLAGQLGDLPK